MKTYFHILGTVGLLLAIYGYGVASAILYSNIPWYIYYTVGGTFFLAWLNQFVENDSLFGKSTIYLLKTYGLYLLFTILIEIVRRCILILGNYPSFNLTNEYIHLFFIGYPFAFFYINESFKLILSKIHPVPITIILVTFIDAFVHEISSIFAWEWVYTIPYITFEVLQVNIVVIVGWVILIAVPLITKRILK